MQRMYKYGNSVIIKEERLSSEEYIDFLKRTDLGSQYPKERFEERIKKLVDNVSVSLVARVVGMLFFHILPPCYFCNMDIVFFHKPFFHPHSFFF